MQVSIYKMQRYILGWCGLLAAFAATFPIAMFRVSQTEKFAGQAVTSQTCETNSQAGSRTVVSWMDQCRHMSVAPRK